MQANDAHQQLSEPSLGGFDTDLDSGTIGRASMDESMHMPAQPSIGYGEFSRARHGMDTSYVSALKRLGACLTPESGASQPPRLNVISRHSSAGQPGVISPRSSAPSSGDGSARRVPIRRQRVLLTTKLRRQTNCHNSAYTTCPTSPKGVSAWVAGMHVPKWLPIVSKPPGQLSAQFDDNVCNQLSFVFPARSLPSSTSSGRVLIIARNCRSIFAIAPFLSRL